MVETVVTAVLDVGKSLASPIGRQFMYLYNYRSNFEKMKKEVTKLKDARDEVKDKVDAAVKNVEKIKHNVKDWEENVNSNIDEAEKLIQKKETSYRCFNFMTSYKNGRKASKQVEALSELLKDKATFGEVSLPSIIEDRRLINNDYKAFESRNSIWNDVLTALNNDERKIIGIYGMGGIGKTTLVKEIGNQAKKKQLFDEVVFVEVPQNPSTERIQEEIAQQLGLKFDTETEKASKLYARLNNKEKKILIILDNLWEAIDLKTIGLPDGDDNGRCKFLLTTRERNVLLNMGSKIFQIDNLSEEESWRLFKSTAWPGDLTEKRKLKSLPKDICQKCGCLPMTIVTVASALKNKREPLQWKEALRQLKRSSPENFTGDTSRAYVSIQLSYNYLRSDLKKTFLLCSLMSHQGFILDLVIYALGLDIFPNIFTIEDARNKVYALISELKDSSLLLNDQTNDSFSMHDFIREVALSLAKGEDHVFSVRNEMNWRWPSEDEQKICKKIFIRDSTITGLREKFECPELELFYMNTKVGDSHVEIPEDFFKVMRNVKVLDLTRMKFSSLRSSSIPLLTKLQTLRLDNSVVDDIAVIGQLRTLKILSLRYSTIRQLPKEIGQLTQLILLDLSNCQRLTVIAPNVISGLYRLEELYMRGCFVLQKIGGLNIERRKAILDELNGLSHLATLEIQFNDANIFPQGLFSKELLRYNISISDIFLLSCGSCNLQDLEPFDEDGTLRTLRLECNSINWSEKFRCFKNVEFLCIGKLQCIGNVLNELERESSSQPSSSQLKHLHLHNTPNLSCIFNSTNCRDGVVFCNLESLILLNLNELKNICSGHLTEESFCNLKIIDVKGCVKLENIFSFANASSLPQLQTMKMESCDNMKQIFAVERGENENNNEVIDQIKFYQLRSLTLNFLPHLTSFYSEVKKPSTLQEGWQDELDTPILLSNMKVAFPNLKTLDLRAINVKKIWDHQNPALTPSYKNLKRLILWDCKNLKYAFPSSLVKNFEQLEHLEIRNCISLKKIVKLGSEATAFVFPRVTFLSLRELPKLKAFYSRKHTHEWPLLKELLVSCYEKVERSRTNRSDSKDNERQPDISEPRYLYLLEKIKFLEHLEITGFDELISLSPSSPVAFQNLKVLKVTHCNGFVNLMTSSIAKSLEQLREMEITACHVMIEVVKNEGDAGGDEKIVFKNLTYLLLNDLKSLKCFYSGNCTLEFPSLEKLEVNDCHKMKTFCQGVLRAEKLLEVKNLRYDEKFWKDDLNTTILRVYRRHMIRDKLRLILWATAYLASVQQPSRIIFVLSGFMAIVWGLLGILARYRGFMIAAAFYGILCIYYCSVIHSQDWTEWEPPKSAYVTIFYSIIFVLIGLMAIWLSLHGILARSRGSLITAAFLGILCICYRPVLHSQELLLLKALEVLLATFVFLSFLVTLVTLQGLNDLPSWAKWLLKESGIIMLNVIGEKDL